MSETFVPSQEVARRAGVTYRQLDYWCSSDLFGDDKVGRGSGTRRRFTKVDVELATLLGEVSRSFPGRITTKFLLRVRDTWELQDRTYPIEVDLSDRASYVVKGPVE